MLEYECAVCGKPISPRFWVCADCRDAWELHKPLKDWPEWAKALKEYEQARRRQLASSPFCANLDDVDDRYPSERGLGYAFGVLEWMGIGVDG